MRGVPDSLKKLLNYDNSNSDLFSNIQLVNLKVKREETLKELGYCVPMISKPAFNAAVSKGYVTLPVVFGVAKNEIYDIDGNYVCYLVEV